MHQATKYIKLVFMLAPTIKAIMEKLDPKICYVIEENMESQISPSIRLKIRDLLGKYFDNPADCMDFETAADEVALNIYQARKPTDPKIVKIILFIDKPSKNFYAAFIDSNSTSAPLLKNTDEISEDKTIEMLEKSERGNGICLIRGLVDIFETWPASELNINCAIIGKGTETTSISSVVFKL